MSEDKPKSDAPADKEGSDEPSPLGEIEQGPSKFEEFLEKHQKALFTALILGIIGLASFIVVKGLRELKEENAGEALVSSKDPGDFRNVIKDYDGTAAAGTAQVQLARSLWVDQEFEEAKQTLKDFIKNSPDHPAQPTARMVLADFLLEESEEDTDTTKQEEAIAILQALADDEKAIHLAPLALIRIADYEIAQGNDDAAREALERAASPDTKNSLLIQDVAGQRLASVGVKLPKIVPRPKPPSL